jgi:hypothetical protein
MIALLVMIAAATRWRTNASPMSMERSVFEEEYPPEVLTLGLNGN